MTDQARVDFAGIPWTETAAGARAKIVQREGSRLRLVEFTPEFQEAEWCTRAHRGFVLDGALELIFADRTEVLHAGDGIFIEHGEGGRHKAVVRSGVARLLLVDEA